MTMRSTPIAPFGWARHASRQTSARVKWWQKYSRPGRPAAGWMLTVRNTASRAPPGRSTGRLNWFGAVAGTPAATRLS